MSCLAVVSQTNCIIHSFSFLLHSFKVLLDEVEVYSNEDQTRTFIGIKAEADNKNLTELTSVLDECLALYNLPQFYKNPSFHASILWTLGDQTEKLKSLKNKLQAKMESIIEIEDEYLYFSVGELFCKCGNRMYKFALR